MATAARYPLDEALEVKDANIQTGGLAMSSISGLTATVAGLVEEAPVNGNRYVRKDAAWNKLESPTFAEISSGTNTAAAMAVGSGSTLVPDGTGEVKANRADVLVFPKAAGNGLKVDTTSPSFGWRDLLGRIQPKTVGAGTPTLATYRGGNVNEFAFAASDVVDLQFHMPHDWAGTDLFIHVHWSHHGTAISGSFVCDFYTTFAKGFGGAIFPAEVNTTLTVSTPDVATIPQYSHRTDEVQLSAASPTANQIDTDNLEVDALLLIRMKTTTIPTITGGATNKPFVHHIDIHYQSTSMGTKAKAPNFYT